MVASNRCTIFCQSILWLKAVMNKVSLNVLCLITLSLPSLPWSSVQSILQSIHPSTHHLSPVSSPAQCPVSIKPSQPKQLHAPTHLFNALQPIRPPSAVSCKKHSCQSIPLNVLSRSFQVNIIQSVHRSTPEAVHKPTGSVSSSPST